MCDYNVCNEHFFEARDDDLPEERRDYLLTLTSATTGLEVSHTAKHAKITMAASDNPFGIFSLTQQEIRLTEEEGMVRSTLRQNRHRDLFRGGTIRSSNP